MAKLTKTTLKYMGAVKDGALPNPKSIDKLRESLVEYYNTAYGDYVKWRSDSNFTKLVPMFSDFDPEFKGLADEMDKNRNAFFDTMDKVLDSLTDLSAQASSQPASDT